MSRALLLLSPLLLVACQDYKLHDVDQAKFGEPMVEVTPQQLKFEGIPGGAQSTQSFTVKSVGDGYLSVGQIRLEGSGAFTVLSGGDGGELAPNESMDVEVAYSPESELDQGSAIVSSDDAVNSEVVVELLGGEVFPQLEVSPKSIDFGNVTQGKTETLYMDLENVGDATVTITEATTPSAPFSMTWNLPLDIAPGEREQVEVHMSPTEFGTFSDQVTITSNDPDGPLTVDIEGMSASQPVAVCSATPNPVAAIYDSTTFFGSGSYDPQGLAITAYKWTLLSQPSGSSVTMPGSITDANRRNFTPDLVGDYVAQLVVTNTQGIDSDPCEVTVVAEASSDLWIEMHWKLSGDDMDLHLVAPGGVLNSTDDCYYQNCTGGRLDWGVRGFFDDNPRLDLDDIPGTGPENINIQSPAAGLYSVYVNDYPGSEMQRPNDVVVTIYVGGVKVWTDTRTLTGENTFEPFATVDWPSGVVTSL